MKYYNNCDQNVEPEGKVNWLIFAILFLFAGFPGIIYLVYCLLTNNESCPQCGAHNWGQPEDGEEAEDDE